MPKTARCRTTIYGVSLVLFGGMSLAWQGRGASAARRAVTVRDTIEMTRIAGTAFPGVRPKNEFAIFSPDKKRFAAVLSKGNTDDNTNDYSIVLFMAADVFRAPRPRRLITFASSSNRAGIFDLRWMSDSDTLLFLGSPGSDPTELYSINCRSGKLKKITHHPTSILSYSASDDGTVAYIAQARGNGLADSNVLRKGLAVTTENIADLISGEPKEGPELFLKRPGGARAAKLATLGVIDREVHPLFLSPDGRQILLKTDVAQAPDRWKRYNDPAVQGFFRMRLRLLRYELVDTHTGKSDFLLDAPAPFSLSDVLWSPDSQSVLLCGTYLPLDVDDPVDLKERASHRFVVELILATRATIPITKKNLAPLAWDAQTNVVEFSGAGQTLTDGLPDLVLYRKLNGGWATLPTDPHLQTAEGPQIVAEQDLNSAPRIVAIDRVNQKKATLLDLNPQFFELAFGEVKTIEWQDDAGNYFDGALYLPPNYRHDRRYPLVIQTHGYDPHGFWIEGAYTTADAAQPLAGKGIVVLQLNDIFADSLDTPGESRRVIALYEGAVKYLDEQRIIDPGRVGLTGFSRAGFYLTSALAQSNLHIAAAILGDGNTGGYEENVLFYNSSPDRSLEFDAIFGGPPFAAGLASWLQNSPMFHLDRIETPVEIQALGPSSLLGEWELFSGLKRLDKPVDLLYLPEGTHVLVKPWERMASEQAAVDWYCFWLNGEEDPAPGKAPQYARWRQLRAQLQSHASAADPSKVLE